MAGLPRLYLITDRKLVPGGDLMAHLDTCLQAGVRLVQLREKDLGGGSLLSLASSLLQRTRKYRARLLVNDRADVALACGADGVHLTSTDPPVTAVRELLGPDLLIGVSTHTTEEARRAAADGADFVTFGPVFDTPSKRSMGEPTGIAALAAAARETEIPVFALGGIHIGQAPEVAASGCHGIACISEIMAASDPAAATRDLLTHLPG